MGQMIIQVDAFTDTPYRGNPAAVCILDRAADEDWMQSVAREMNLSETAFLHPEQDGYRLRWFGPLAEVDLCGHATLASAHALWEQNVLAPHSTARFHTRSGLLTASKDGEWINLNFPVEPAQQIEIDRELIDALGITPCFVGKNRVDYIVQVESEEMLKTMQPDFGKLQLYADWGFMVTSSASTEGFDYVSRFFAPGRGVNEDPVTGSSHCCLAPFWGERLDQREFMAFQASQRGGVVKTALDGDRVIIAGRAITIMRGKLLY